MIQSQFLEFQEGAWRSMQSTQTTYCFSSLHLWIQKTQKLEILSFLAHLTTLIPLQTTNLPLDLATILVSRVHKHV